MNDGVREQLPMQRKGEKIAQYGEINLFNNLSPGLRLGT